MTPPGKLVMVRVLGPVDFVTEDGVGVVGSHNGRMLLAALALAANHTTSSDQLAQVLWGDEPPASRDNTLQTYIARLRASMGHERITSEDHSYELRVEPHELDALVFESTLNEAMEARTEPERCLELCKEALGLWRGPPFGELADIDPFRLEAIRLDELRLFAMELEMECQIAIGREEMTVGTLQALAEEYPYRERIWFLLIAALALSGRRVEALRAVEDLRKLLARAGIGPSAEIRQLEEEIISEAPSMTPRLRLVLGIVE